MELDALRPVGAGREAVQRSVYKHDTGMQKKIREGTCTYQQ